MLLMNLKYEEVIVFAKIYRVFLENIPNSRAGHSVYHFLATFYNGFESLISKHLVGGYSLDR